MLPKIRDFPPCVRRSTVMKCGTSTFSMASVISGSDSLCVSVKDAVYAVKRISLHSLRAYIVAATRTIFTAMC